jgi:hypothetical protein
MMTWKEQCDLLYGDLNRLSKINYFISENGTTIAVNAIAYTIVAKAVCDHRISIYPLNIPQGVSAVYDNELNLLNVDFAKVQTPYQQSEVLHECTHALLDLFKAFHFTYLTSEVAAYLSQTLYLKAINKPLPKSRILFGADRHDPMWDDIFVKADMLAQKQNLYAGNTAPFLVRADFQSLRDAIQPFYKNLPIAMRHGPEEEIPDTILGVP